MKAYLDNVIVCGRVRNDLEETQMTAVQQIVDAAERGQLSIVTSCESWREQDRTRDANLRSKFEQNCRRWAEAFSFSGHPNSWPTLKSQRYSRRPYIGMVSPS